MLDNLNIYGEYKIERINKKTGYKELVCKKKNKLTPMFKSFIVSCFSNMLNAPFYNLGATNGEIMGTLGLFSKDNNYKHNYFQNSLRLYGLNENVNVESFNDYPFLTGIREIDDSKITFIGTEQLSVAEGSKYAVTIPTYNINALFTNAISKSWKLTGPNGLGMIKTLCLGKNVDTEQTNDDSSVLMQNSNPFFTKKILSHYKDNLNNLNLITGYLPNLTGVSDNIFYFGSLSTNILKYDLSSDTYTYLETTDDLRNIPLAKLGQNCIIYNNNMYFGHDDYNQVYKYNITTKDLTRLSASLRNYSNVFKKGNMLLCNYYNNSGDTSIYVYNLDTDTLDTSLFGSNHPTLTSIIKNTPSWFVPKFLGTRNDNENWLILDPAKQFCIECTDINDVKGSLVKTYITTTISHTIINNKLYWITKQPYIEKEITRNITSYGDGTYDSTFIGLTDSTVPSYMFSIVTDLKDSTGADIVQTEDTEYIFTYTLQFN